LYYRFNIISKCNSWQAAKYPGTRRDNQAWTDGSRIDIYRGMRRGELAIPNAASDD
jgi:hypothetical protein